MTGSGATTAASTTTVGGTTATGWTTAAGGRATNSRSSPSESGPFAFAKCMRANGVPSYPDPKPGVIGRIPIGGNPASPTFRAAQTKCEKLVPGNGLPGSGSPPSAQTLAKLRTIAICMRQHNGPQFPDPRTSIPSNVQPGEYQVITDYDGAILLFPTTINLQAPAYRQALAACGAPPLGLPH
jgi:hypothetical protein